MHGGDTHITEITLPLCAEIVDQCMERTLLIDGHSTRDWDTVIKCELDERDAGIEGFLHILQSDGVAMSLDMWTHDGLGCAAKRKETCQGKARPQGMLTRPSLARRVGWSMEAHRTKAS